MCSNGLDSAPEAEALPMLMANTRPHVCAAARGPPLRTDTSRHNSQGRLLTMLRLAHTDLASGAASRAVGLLGLSAEIKPRARHWMRASRELTCLFRHGHSAGPAPRNSHMGTKASAGSCQRTQNQGWGLTARPSRVQPGMASPCVSCAVAPHWWGTPCCWGLMMLCCRPPHCLRSSHRPLPRTSG